MSRRTREASRSACSFAPIEPRPMEAVQTSGCRCNKEAGCPRAAPRIYARERASELSATEARQGETSLNMLVVLLASMALAASALIGVALAYH